MLSKGRIFHVIVWTLFLICGTSARWSCTPRTPAPYTRTPDIPGPHVFIVDPGEPTQRSTRRPSPPRVKNTYAQPSPATTTFTQLSITPKTRKMKTLTLHNMGLIPNTRLDYITVGTLPFEVKFNFEGDCVATDKFQYLHPRGDEEQAVFTSSDQLSHIPYRTGFIYESMDPNLIVVTPLTSQLNNAVFRPVVDKLRKLGISTRTEFNWNEIASSDVIQLDAPSQVVKYYEGLRSIASSKVARVCQVIGVCGKVQFYTSQVFHVFCDRDRECNCPV